MTHRVMKRIGKAVDRVEETALAILLALVVGIAFADVVVRNLGISLSRVQEFLPNLFVWMVWLGVPYAIRKGENFRVRLIPEKRRGRFALPLLWTGAVVGVVFFCLTGWYGVSVVLLDIRTGATTPLGYSAAWLDLAMPVGSALAVCRLIQRLPGKHREGEGQA